MSTPRVTYRPGGSAYFTVPYRAAWVQYVKSRVPSDHRSWNPDDKEWLIWPPYVDAMIDFTESCFGYVEIEGDPEPPPKAKAPANPADPYVVLHLRETAPPELIAAAYRTLSLKFHPDKGGNEERMKQINNAYDELRDRI